LNGLFHQRKAVFAALDFFGQLLDRLIESFHIVLLLLVRKSLCETSAIAIDFTLQAHGESFGEFGRKQHEGA